MRRCDCSELGKPCSDMIERRSRASTRHAVMSDEVRYCEGGREGKSER